jgi:ABC-type amino acid transport substrate-binding protein
VNTLCAALAALLFVPAIALAQAASPPLEGRLKKIKDSQSIAVAYRTDAAPFSFDENKQPSGDTNGPCRRIVGAIEQQLAVITGTGNERALAAALTGRVINATVAPVVSRDDGLAQPEAGSIDAFAGDRVLLVGLASKARDQKSLALLTDALSFEPDAIALPRGDWQLRPAVNTALARIYRSGAIGEIWGRWFSAFGRPGPLVETLFLFGAIAE